jgi:hypothetical protein
MKRTVVEEFDNEGRLVRRVTTEEFEALMPMIQPAWVQPPITIPYSPPCTPGSGVTIVGGNVDTSDIIKITQTSNILQ